MLSVRLNDPEPRPTNLTVRTSECRERECERHPRARLRWLRLANRYSPDDPRLVSAVPGLRSSSDILRDGAF
jgi:hypothetical protein